MATTLRFTGPGSSALPVRLRFGDADDGPPPAGDATLAIAATITRLAGSVPLQLGARMGLQASVTALTGAVGLRYASDTQRPTVGAAHATWQGAQAAPRALAARYQRAHALPLFQRVQWQRAVPASAALTPQWADANRSARAWVAPRWQDAAPARAPRLLGLWQDSLRRRAGARATWLEAEQLGTAPSHQSYQDAERGYRPWVRDAFADGLALRQRVQDAGTHALPVRTARGVRYQEAWPPRPGRWVRPVQPPAPDPCYAPGLPVRLVFAEAALAGLLPRLRFFCERHSAAGPQPGTVIVPIRSVYVTINALSLTRASDGARIPTSAFGMSLDVDSWTWQWQATLHADALPLITPSGADPVELLASINGTPYRLAAESYTRQRQFASTRISVRGRGRAAVLDAPYAPTLNFGNASARTAQQLMADVLTINGVGIGWDVDWGLTDWLVPGNVWAHQGSYISALLDIAGAAGAYLQPHDTAQTLRVLPRYPAAPWDWASLTPDYELPAAVVSVEGTEWLQKPAYERVYVSGTSAGVVGQVTRAGTAGGVLAPMVTHPLITHADAARQRGIAVLGDSGRQARLSLRLPVLEETGVIKPGALVRYVDAGVPAIGLVRGTQVEWSRPTLRQVLSVETHPEA